MEIDFNLIEDVELDGVNYADYPDFSDAYICGGIYNGKPMSDEMIDELNDNHSDYVYQCVIDSIF